MEKKSVGLLELETAVLECFLEKTPLSPLGVKPHKRFCALQPDFSLPFDNFNNHFGNYVWPILGLYAIQLRLVLKQFYQCFFCTFVMF
jgi:hypothetical protein